jgi:acetolactate synthase-1/3 small subunit
LAQIFRARIVDVGESTFILAITGDPGKLTAFQKVLGKFGVVELVRTGRIALKRGESLFDDGNGATFFEGNSGGSDSPSTSATRVEYANSGLDVYAADAIETGVWNVSNILDAAYTPEAHGFEPFTLSIDVQDVPGVLNQVTGVIARRGYNVQSLAVGNSEKPGMSRITMVVPGDSASIANLTKQLLKLVYVSSVTELHRIPHVARELMLVKVACQPSQRGEILDLTKIFHASVCDVSRSTMTIEVVGKESKMRALQEVLQPYGILEIARTGRVALARDSGVDSRYLSGMAGSRIML